MLSEIRLYLTSEPSGNHTDNQEYTQKMNTKRTSIAVMLSTLLIPLLSSCGVVEVSVNQDKLHNLTIEGLDTQRIEQFSKQAEKLVNSTPEETFRTLGEQAGIDTSTVNLRDLKEEICVKSTNTTDLSASILRIAGAPLTQEQAKDVVTLGLSSFCPEKAPQ